MSNWISVKDKLPDKKGEYLCLSKVWGDMHYAVLYFAKDLYKLDDHKFCDRKGQSGFCAYDSEWGYCEMGVEFWMPHQH